MSKKPTGAPRRIQLNKGDRFGKLVVIKEAEKYSLPCGTSQRRFLCKCDCGNKSEVFLSLLRSGTTQSCGCAGKHGHSRTPEYDAWDAMVQRCTNPKNPSYPRYGGRGITIDPLFLDFPAFLLHIGKRPSKLYSLDREDNEKGYIPGNIRWVLRRTQNLNRCNTKLYEYQGLSLALCEWAERTGIQEKSLWSRLNVLGWSIEKALTTPVNSAKLNIPAP